MPPGTKLKIGLNVSKAGFKERGIGQIKDASSSVIRTNRSGPASNSYITTLLELFRYAADDGAMGIPYSAKKPSGQNAQKNYVKKIKELFVADPDSGDHLKTNTGWMYSLRTKAPPARYNDLVSKWGKLVKSGKPLGDIYDDLINSATDNIFAAIEKHQKGAKARMEFIQKSKSKDNVKANDMVDLMYSSTWKDLPDEYTLELADKTTIENLLKARSVGPTKMRKAQAYEVETPSGKRYVYTFKSDFVSKMSKKFSVKMTKDLIKKKLKAKFPKEKTGLDDIGWHANYYLGNIAQANQFTDLSSAALTPDALNVNVATPNGSETIAEAIADNQTVLSTYTLDSDGQPVGKVEEAGNFSTFITQFMISGYNYYYFKIVLDVDPTNSNPESDNGLYARALQGLLGTGVARMTSSGSKASEAVPRRQYSQHIKKSPRSFDLSEMQLYKDEVQKQFNAIAQVVLDKSRLNELTEALNMAATPDAVGYDPNRITDLVTKIQEETKRLNKAHNQLYGSKSSNESQRSKVALISERIYSNMFDGGFDYADVIQSAEQSSIVKYRASFLEYLHHLLLNLILLSGDQNQVNSLADDQVVFLKSLNIDQVSAPDSGEQEATQASPDAPSNDDLFVDDALAQYDPKVASQNPVLQERKSLSAVDEYKKLLYNSRRRR
ncbi:MAG TPA: hypothetical protein DF712_17810 [Balneola sp.]|nr:hypothetical protein [Balneola sp.]